MANSFNGGMIGLLQQGFFYQVGPLCSRKRSGSGVYGHDTRAKSVQKEFINTICTGENAQECIQKRIMLHDTGAGDELRANKEEMEILSMDRCTENVIEFLENQQQATVTFSQGRYKTRIRKLVEARPEECQIVAENKDGSICAHIPTTWVRIAPPPVRTEAQREASRRNALKLPRAGREKR